MGAQQSESRPGIETRSCNIAVPVLAEASDQYWREAFSVVTCAGRSA